MKQSIYLIDDDQQFQYLFSTCFGDLNEDVAVTAYNRAETVLEHLMIYRFDPNKLPDTIVVDLNLPSMNGVEFVKDMEERVALLSKKPDIYIVSVNKDPDVTNLLHGHPLVRGFFTKPITSDICSKFLKVRNKITA